MTTERRYRWTSLGQVISWYVRTQERCTSAPSTERAFQELAEYGGHVSSGRACGAPGGGVNRSLWMPSGQGGATLGTGREIHRASNRDVTMGDVSLVEACLPRGEPGVEGGLDDEQAAVARAMLLLCCGGDRGDGMSREDAASLCRRHYGEEWTDARCARLLQRAQWETRVRLQAKRILPGGGDDRAAGARVAVAAGKSIAREARRAGERGDDALERLCERYAVQAREGKEGGRRG